MPTLLERDEHLHHLERLLADCRARRGRTVLLDGPIGSGRTALLRACAERARRMGFTTLDADCAPAERALPFGVVNQLLAEGLVERTPLTRAPDAAEDVRAHAELATAFARLADHRPLMIGVDGLRHADDESLRLLLFLARRLRSAPVLLVMTDGPTATGGRQRLLADLCRLPHVRRLTLAPLSAAGTARLVADRLGAQAVPRLAADLHEHSGGSPLLLEALIEDERTPGGRSLSPAVQNLLHGGEPAHLRTARALAVLGDDADAADLARLAGADGADGADALSALRAAGLLDGMRFRHPGARAAVLEDLPPRDRRELHRRAAVLRQEAAAPASVVARHLLAADHTGEPWAPAVLSEAAEQALLDDRPDVAVECLQAAHRAHGDDRGRAAIRARLAQAEWQLNPAAAARHLTPLVAAVRADRLGVRDATVLVKHLLWHGRDAEAAEVLARLRAHAEHARGRDGGGILDLETWLAYRHPPLARDRRAPEPPGAVTAPRIDPVLRSAAVLADALARNRAHGAADHAERTLRDLVLHRRDPWAEEAAMTALQVLILADRLETTVEWCDRLTAEAEARTLPTVRALFAAARAEVALRLGDPAPAAEHARAALTHLPPQAWGVTVGLPYGTLILAATRTGDHDEAARQLARPIPDGAERSFAGVYHRYARGHHRMATGHLHAAIADFLTCGDLVRDWGLDAAGLIPWRTDAAEAWVRLGQREQARRLVREQLGRPGAHASRVRGPALRVLASAGPADRRLPLLAEALELAEASGDRYEQALVLAGLGRAHLARGGRRRARLLLRQALHLAEVGGMAALSRDLLAVSGDLGGPATPSAGPAGIAALTESERRVASLAVLGYTNREIADRLFVTPSTVEQHLTRVYRKLNVRDRRQLPADLRTTTRSPAG
ncbi:AAA family ATPase [Thermomonospora umbrina]|uniref:Regulatory LuxR family protein n=1 Tax=Thermomonospora umbrina TaxID=111806 RepID=A0A3D9SFU5_9ACTN|nr:LuxR family transcriptional regulator [Thermomonospora umbrina]REE94808.1 regulatory LuxR family protein [Thermomonospora umbrina]